MSDYKFEDIFENIARIRCHLNSWEWDDFLGEPPTGWDDMCWQERYPIIKNLINKTEEMTSNYVELLDSWYHFQHHYNPPKTFEEWIKFQLDMIPDKQFTYKCPKSTLVERIVNKVNKLKVQMHK